MTSADDTLKHKPRQILVDVENRLLQINWADAHESVFDFTLLRRACPCAECRPWVHGGEVGKSPESVRHAVGELNAVSDVSAVGNYAINFRWADGHATGIYDFKFLRELDEAAQILNGEKSKS
jgi:DUF971 family protein